MRRWLRRLPFLMAPLCWVSHLRPQALSRFAARPIDGRATGESGGDYGDIHRKWNVDAVAARGGLQIQLILLNANGKSPSPIQFGLEATEAGELVAQIKKVLHAGAIHENPRVEQCLGPLIWGA